MKNAKLIKKLEEAPVWRQWVPGLLLTIKERNVILKLLRALPTEEAGGRT